MPCVVCRVSCAVCRVSCVVCRVSRVSVPSSSLFAGSSAKAREALQGDLAPDFRVWPPQPGLVYVLHIKLFYVENTVKHNYYDLLEEHVHLVAGVGVRDTRALCMSIVLNISCFQCRDELMQAFSLYTPPS